MFWNRKKQWEYLKNGKEDTRWKEGKGEESEQSKSIIISPPFLMHQGQSKIRLCLPQAPALQADTSTRIMKIPHSSQILTRSQLCSLDRRANIFIFILSRIDFNNTISIY